MYEQGRCRSSGPIRNHDYFAAVKLTAIAVPLPIALELDLRAVVLCGMLDDGKAKTGAANLLGMTFIDAVKSLKYTALVGVGNADASICDGKRCRQPTCQTEMATLPPGTLYLIALSHKL